MTLLCVQVHEKSLLLSLIPASLLLSNDPIIIIWYQILGCFSMFSLFIKDNLRIPYILIILLYLILIILQKLFKPIFHWNNQSNNQSNKQKFNNIPYYWKLSFVSLSIAGMFSLHQTELFIAQPQRYPDLYSALFAIYSTFNLIIMYFITIYWLYTSNEEMNENNEIEKNNNTKRKKNE